MSDLKKIATNRRRKPLNRRKASPANDDIVQQLLQKYEGINIFFITMVIVSVFVLVTGIAVAKNVADYRSNYTQLQEMKDDYRLLQIEYQKLLIEQQTFSAIPKVASRAVTELNMYYPTMKDKIILKAQPITEHENMLISTITDNDANSSSVEGE